jgi:hypothetical protein
MSLFRCSKCGAVENTAVSRYWLRKEDGNDGLCTECDPKIGKWHGIFPKELAAGKYLLLSDGFLCTPEFIETDSFKWREKHQGLKVVGPA